MKKILIILLAIIVHKYSYAQNKKEQIIILQNTLDSINIEYKNEVKIKNNLSFYKDSINKVFISKQAFSKELLILNTKLKDENEYNKNRIDSINNILNKKEKELIEFKNKLSEAIKNNLKNEVKSKVSKK